MGVIVGAARYWKRIWGRGASGQKIKIRTAALSSAPQDWQGNLLIESSTILAPRSGLSVRSTIRQSSTLEGTPQRGHASETCSEREWGEGIGDPSMAGVHRSSARSVGRSRHGGGSVATVLLSKPTADSMDVVRKLRRGRRQRGGSRGAGLPTWAARFDEAPLHAEFDAHANRTGEIVLLEPGDPGRPQVRSGRVDGPGVGELRPGVHPAPDLDRPAVVPPRLPSVLKSARSRSFGREPT